MKIVCISDTHGSHQKLSLPAGDVLIHAGDFMRSGRDYSEIIDFNAWLELQPFRYKIVIAGNHDIFFEQAPQVAQSLLSAATYLRDSAITLSGIKFYGSPVQPEFLNWAFNIKRGKAIKRYWDQIPTDVDVLITHGPPMGVLDTTSQGEPNYGCEELRKAVDRIRPKAHIFGHIHGGYGEWRCPESGTHFINAASMNEAYQVVNRPVTLAAFSKFDLEVARDIAFPSR